jgi:hypothetical protein
MGLGSFGILTVRSIIKAIRLSNIEIPGMLALFVFENDTVGGQAADDGVFIRDCAVGSQ